MSSHEPVGPKPIAPPAADIHWRQRLTLAKIEIEALVENHGKNADPVELDQSRIGRLSRIDALQIQAMAQAAERRRQKEIERIDAALRRLDAGTFGDCVHCDEEIGIDRLKVDPATPFCLACARNV